MCKDCQDASHSSTQHEGLSRRTLLKTGIGLASTLTVGGLQIWGLAPSAQAASAEPLTIASCDDWGARPPASPIVVLDKKSTKILVHHTSFENSNDFSLEAAYAMARYCQKLHIDGNGWADTGQHFTVSRGGHIMEGRHRSLEVLRAGFGHVQSAHCPSLNNEAIGIENDGNYMTELPPAATWNSLVDLCEYICQQYGFGANFIFGHRDFRNTDCPGNAFYAKLPELREQIAARLGQTITGRTWPDLRPVVTGYGVRTVQYLLRSQGANITIDGTFGPTTDTLVKAFQTSKGIVADGYTRNDTWEALVVPFEKDGEAHPDVITAIQELLKRNGLAVEVTGTFDAATKHGIKETQRNHHLPAHAKLDLDTWCAIVGGVVAKH